MTSRCETRRQHTTQTGHDDDDFATLARRASWHTLGTRRPRYLSAQYSTAHTNLPYTARPYWLGACGSHAAISPLFRRFIRMPGSSLGAAAGTLSPLPPSSLRPLRSPLQGFFPPQLKDTHRGAAATPHPSVPPRHPLRTSLLSTYTPLLAAATRPAPHAPATTPRFPALAPLAWPHRALPAFLAAFLPPPPPELPAGAPPPPGGPGLPVITSERDTRGTCGAASCAEMGADRGKRGPATSAHRHTRRLPHRPDPWLTSHLTSHLTLP
jgi:hypothetical protein